MLIALEGADACGKATQTKLLVEHLRAAGIAAESMSFPDYSTETGRAIRWMLTGDLAFEGAGAKRRVSALAIQSLMTANRYEHWAKLAEWDCSISDADPLYGGRRVWVHEDDRALRPAVLVLDRFWLSGLVYGQADGLDRDWLLAVHAALPPAHHLILDVPSEEALRRRPEARDRFEADREKQARVRQIYLEEWSRSLLVNRSAGGPLQGRVHRVDSVGLVEEVAGRVRAVADDLISGRTR